MGETLELEVEIDDAYAQMLETIENAEDVDVIADIEAGIAPQIEAGIHEAFQRITHGDQ